MSSIFRKDDNYVDKPKRNTFDLSHQNNLTTNFGKLAPVLCQEVLPGDSFKIDTSFGLRFMPQVFPVQTRQRASVKFYYVRNRNLWKDWMDFIGKTKSDLTLPYLKFSNSYRNRMLPSELLDYMGVPMKVTPSPDNNNRVLRLQQFWLYGKTYVMVPQGGIITNGTADRFARYTAEKLYPTLYSPTNSSELTPGTVNFAMQNYRLGDIYGQIKGSTIGSLPNAKFAVDISANTQTMLGLVVHPDVWCAFFREPFKTTSGCKFVPNFGRSNVAYCVVRTDSGVDIALPMQDGEPFTIPDSVTYVDKVSYEEQDINYITEGVSSFVGIVSSANSVVIGDWDVNVTSGDNSNLYWCDLNFLDIPYCSDVNPDGLRLSALPFRAYQAVYNALIRNAENNPLKIGGVPEYNKYIISDAGGAVTNLGEELRMQYSNWSDDRFTTALPSPQQGNAPLVGLTGVQGATINLANADGTNASVHLQVDADTGNVVMVDGHSDNVSEASLDSIINAVDYGITINDFRNVNSYQRWLENNIRRGYKYKDQLMSHYGVNARFDVLDMPEFIGGVSRDVNVQQVTQTVENEYGNLGDYAGQSYVMGNGHSIEHYCDEHGYIIGIMEIKPMPLYHDYLPKHFVKSDPLDYYFPEFSKIGMQPISNKELAFSQSFLENDMDGTFGYQRAWYDYLENLDSVHGLFNSDLKNFLISRDFRSMPTLSKSFLTLYEGDLNNTFYVDDLKDKIIGQLYFDISAKRPIPMIGIPALE